MRRFADFLCAFADQLPDEVNEDCRRLYALIRRRFLAGYMRPAVYRVITVELESDAITVSERELLEAGYRKVYSPGSEEIIRMAAAAWRNWSAASV